LILDIFSQRARSFEGKLQVELAQLSHLSTRLVRGWTHLERQKGGIGLRGPGETQLETDRRLIGKRIKTLRSRLEKLAQQRDTGRHVRREVPVPTVALVGYTNAGKSTLFNALTGSSTYVADQLFATLDPTVRQLKLQGVGEVVLADTVGFVRDLPHELVAAFRSTLQEAREADLLLHVVDASDPLRQERIEQVRGVLRGIGAGELPELLVFNKIDLLEEPARVLDDADGLPAQAWISAAADDGLDGLRAAIARAVRPNQVRRTLHVDLCAGAVRSLLYQRNAIREERQLDDGSWEIDVEIDGAELARLAGNPGVQLRPPVPQLVRRGRAA
jgi:GTP-binding protein HflX